MFDQSKIQSAATELGINLQFVSENSSLHLIKPNSNVDILTFNELPKSLLNIENKRQKPDTTVIVTSGLCFIGLTI